MKTFGNILVSILIALTFFACAPAPQPTVALSSPTPVLDLCGPEALPGEVDKAHHLMREFDDASLLGTNTPRDGLPPVISDMQRIRRAAEDQIVPPCLATLKQLQLAHMNTVINTLISFLNGADQDLLNQGAELARQQHNAYAIEYARLLGLTVIVAATSTPDLSVTGTPATPTAVTMLALNDSSDDLNLYSDPSVDSTIVGVLFPDQTARVVTTTADGAWLQVEIPGQVNQFAWVDATTVTLSPAP